MKKLLYLLSAALLLSCTTNSEEFTSGPELFESQKFFLVTSQETSRLTRNDIDMIWSNGLFGSVSANPTFRNYHIKQGSDSGETIYWLSAVSDDNCVEIATRLDRTEEGFLIPKYENGRTCACVGCADGCTLMLEGVTCSCQTYTPSDNNCEKVNYKEVEM